MEFQVQYLFLFHLFSQMHGFTYFRMESLSKSIQLILELLKAPFLVLFYSTSLKIFYARLLFLLMIIPSTLSMSKHLICVNNQNWLLGLNLTYETQWTVARSGLSISELEKLSLLRLIGLVALVLLMWKWRRLFFKKNLFLFNVGAIFLF